MVLLFARIIRPIHDLPIVTRVDEEHVLPTFSPQQYLEIENQLSAFKVSLFGKHCLIQYQRFLDAHNLAVIKGKEEKVEGGRARQPVRRVGNDEAAKAEDDSLSNLHILIVRAIEALNFLGVIESVFSMDDLFKM